MLGNPIILIAAYSLAIDWWVYSEKAYSDKKGSETYEKESNLACYYYTTTTLNEYENNIKNKKTQKKDYMIGINLSHSPLSSYHYNKRLYSRIITV